MWAEIIGGITGTTFIGAGYYGLYKLGWYMSRKEQEHQIKEKIKLIDGIEELQEYKILLEKHLEKLNTHKIEWMKRK